MSKKFKFYPHICEVDINHNFAASEPNFLDFRRLDSSIFNDLESIKFTTLLILNLNMCFQKGACSWPKSVHFNLIDIKAAKIRILRDLN